LDTFSVIRLSSFVVSLYIAVFLFGLKNRSVPTVLLAWAFIGAAILNLSTFLEFACPYYWQSYNLKNLLIPFSQVLGPCIGAVSLLLFTYHFPHFQKPDRKEYRALLLLCVSANLGVALLAYYNFILLEKGQHRWSNLS